MIKHAITTLFCDVGGVLLTNGWDHYSRLKAAEFFSFDPKEFEGRHQLLFGDYEVGKISLKEYLHFSLFFQPRSFTPEAFIEFMYAQSEPYHDMLDLIRQVKKQHHLKIVILSNEGRELTLHRFKKFHLNELADFFLVSSFIGLRKPDHAIYQIALDTSQTPPEKVAYIDDRPLFIEIGQEMGIHAILHENTLTTQSKLSRLF